MTLGELRELVNQAGIDGNRMPDDAPVLISRDVGEFEYETQPIDRGRVTWTCEDIAVTVDGNGKRWLDYNVPRVPRALVLAVVT